MNKRFHSACLAFFALSSISVSATNDNVNQCEKKLMSEIRENENFALVVQKLTTKDIERRNELIVSVSKILNSFEAQINAACEKFQQEAKDGLLSEEIHKKKYEGLQRLVENWHPLRENVNLELAKASKVRKQRNMELIKDWADKHLLDCDKVNVIHFGDSVWAKNPLSLTELLEALQEREIEKHSRSFKEAKKKQMAIIDLRMKDLKIIEVISSDDPQEVYAVLSDLIKYISISVDEYAGKGLSESKNT